jgi:hemolysin activation/secretion protein
MSQVMGVTPPQLSQLPPEPTTQSAIPDIRIQRPGPDTDLGLAGAAVRVDVLRITGETRFSEALLLAATGFTPGKSLNVQDLRRMAVRIRDYYSARGYIVAQAYLPAQRIDNGVVTLVVVEGRYGKVTLNDRARLRPYVGQEVLNGLHDGDVVSAPPLERRLLLLSDIPGVVARSNLGPGAEVGTSDLQVDLTNGHLISGDLEVDNGGNPYTGAYLGGGTININDPLGIGDMASVRVLTSGEGLQYVRGAYQAQLGDATIGASYAAFHYRLGEQFTDLHAHGSEQIASVFASYPLIRSYDNNLRIIVDFDHRTFQDDIDAVGSFADKLANVGVIGLAGNHRDNFAGGGSDNYSVFVSIGDLDIETPSARLADAGAARTDGGYQKVYLSADRLQTVSGAFSIYGAVRGQIASTNLDISEKMELGGPNNVRAYPEGEAYGDEGYLATLEGRAALPRLFPQLPGHFQLIGFFDTGQVRSYRNPFLDGSNRETRSGAGPGLNWVSDNNFMVKVSYAFIINTGPATSYPDTNGQFWFEVVKFF